MLLRFTHTPSLGGITVSQMRTPKPEKPKGSVPGLPLKGGLETTGEFKEQLLLLRTLDEVQDKALCSAPQNCPQRMPSQGRVCRNEFHSQVTGLQTEVLQEVTVSQRW